MLGPKEKVAPVLKHMAIFGIYVKIYGVMGVLNINFHTTFFLAPSPKYGSNKNKITVPSCGRFCRTWKSGMKMAVPPNMDDSMYTFQKGSRASLISIGAGILLDPDYSWPCLVGLYRESII